MSDSSNKENNRANKINNPEASSSGKQSAIAKRSKLSLAVIFSVILAIIGILVFGGVLISEYTNKQQDQNRLTTSNEGEEPSSTTPISILPTAPEGVTILEKQAELEVQPKITTAPIAAGADIAHGFAMELGAAESFLELTVRFSKIVSNNGPENFHRLEPRAVLTETVNGLEAKLLVGPFDSQKDANEACEVLLLPKNITCASTRFEGELIARE